MPIFYDACFQTGGQFNLPDSASMPNELNAVAIPRISGSDNPMVVPAPASRNVISVISDSVVAKLFNYVIVKAFYPLLLMVSHKFGIHFHLQHYLVR